MKKLTKPIIITVLMGIAYMIQFVLAPLIIHNYYHTGSEATRMLLVTDALTALLGMLLVSRKIRYWLFADIVYAVLMYIYDGTGLYGIGYGFGVVYNRSWQWRVPTIIFLLVILIIIQLLSLGIVTIGKKINYRKKAKPNCS